MQILDDYINKIKSLPPAPRILPQLLTLLNEEDVDAGQVVDLITFDPGLTAKLLQRCNSAASALSARCMISPRPWRFSASTKSTAWSPWSLAKA